MYNTYTKIPDYVDVDILVDLDFENFEKKKNFFSLNSQNLIV